MLEYYAMIAMVLGLCESLPKTAAADTKVPCQILGYGGPERGHGSFLVEKIPYLQPRLVNCAAPESSLERVDSK